MRRVKRRSLSILPYLLFVALGGAIPGCGCDDGPSTEDPLCGNGALDTGEQCDDGNLVDNDGCTACVIDETPPECGNELLEGAEECDDGNNIDGDGCEGDCTLPLIEVVCKELPPISSGTCAVTAGDGNRLVVGTVLTPGMIFRGGEVLVDATGQISCVGCDCSGDSAGATRIECPTGVISPSLINTHDHITFAQNDPYTNTGERYEHRHEWRKGSNGHTKISSAGSASGDEISWAELRFLMGGATSTVGSGSRSGLLRNLDRANDQEGLSQDAVNFETFPLGDSGGTQISTGCGYPGIDSAASIAGDDAYLPHIAEGIAASARNEFVCTSSTEGGGQDLVQPQSAFIHGIGLRAGDFATMAQDGTALIWSPRSNITLYGDTAMVTAAARMGVQIALGTDWMPTGSMNMLRELRCADEFNAVQLGGYFSDEDLWRMATVDAAAVTATDDVIGTLAAGKVADIAIFNGAENTDFRAILAAEVDDVVLVMRAGKTLYGDGALVAALTSDSCDSVDVCGTAKSVCLQSEIGKNLAALQSSVGSIYPAFFCDTPTNEPSCVPMRSMAVNGSTVYTGIPTSTDIDGDGIADASDNCPSIFNPVRPLDDGVQANQDGDADGDACDPCPLDADTTTCTTYNPNDPDGDGVQNPGDNCPTIANPTQTDTDMDGKGDDCDACPSEPNPGAAACTVTIYDIKTGVAAVGDTVALTDVLVTGTYASGFFLQVKPGDMGYTGADNSGVFVYSPAHTVVVGDRIDITTATVANFFGQIQLGSAAITVVTSLGEASPAPIAVTAAEVATGGTRATALESVLVEVSDATVTDIAPAPGPGDTAPTYEFVVNGSLRVNDLLYRIAPFPAVNDDFATLRGILEWRNNHSKLELRSAADAVPGTTRLAEFSPAFSFVDVGESSVPTGPVPLTVRLSSPPAANTTVTITSSDPTSLTVVGGGVTVPAGQMTAVVLVNGLAQSASVTLTATLDAVMLTADVRVIGPGEVRTIASLTPASATIAPNGSITLTANLNLPAGPGGQVVSLAVSPLGAGTLPATVTVPAGQLSQTFVYDDAGMVTTATVTATVGGSSANSTITAMASGTALTINEVDYDQLGTDTAEYVELLNTSGAPLSLAGYSLVLVNGSNNTPYLTVDLSPAGTLAVGQYLVVGVAGLAIAPGAAKIDFIAADNSVQNGAPDGVAVVNTNTNTLVDALSYEGGITAAMLEGLGIVSLVEQTALATATADSNTVDGSLCRLPSGVDTNNSSVDWKFCPTLTPGAANAQ